MEGSADGSSVRGATYGAVNGGGVGDMAKAQQTGLSAVAGCVCDMFVVEGTRM